MISLCQVGQGFPVALRRAPGCFTERIHHFAVVPLGAVPARNAEPDIHSLYRVVANRHRRLSECYLPVPKHFEGGLGSMSSVAQSATAGPGRLRSMNLLVLRSGFRPLLFVLLPLRTLVHCGPPQGDRLQASGRPQSKLDWHGPSAFPCHRPTPDQGSTSAPAWLLRSSTDCRCLFLCLEMGMRLIVSAELRSAPHRPQ